MARAAPKTCGSPPAASRIRRTRSRHALRRSQCVRKLPPPGFNGLDPQNRGQGRSSRTPRDGAMKRMAKPSIPERSSDPRIDVSLTVNGETIHRAVSVRMLLSDFLRHELGLIGTRVGCEHGVCGCCTVLIDGKAGRSCLTLAVQANGPEIRTIQALAQADGPPPPIPP